MTIVNIQRFVVYSMENGAMITYNPNNVRDLVEEYLYGTPPMVITLGNLYCIRKCESGKFLCMEISGDMPDRHELCTCNWFYKGCKVDMHNNYGFMESYLHDLKISPNSFQQGYLSTR